MKNGSCAKQLPNLWKNYRPHRKMVGSFYYIWWMPIRKTSEKLTTILLQFFTDCQQENTDDHNCNKGVSFPGELFL